MCSNLRTVLLMLGFFSASCALAERVRIQDSNSFEVPKTTSSGNWQPGAFLGLKIGVSSRQELLQVLGKPLATYDSDEESDVPKDSGSAETVDIFC